MMQYRSIAVALTALPLFAWGSEMSALRGGARKMQTASEFQGVIWEKYNGITGTSLTALTSAANFPDFPTTTTILTERFETPSHIDESYGSRLTTWLVPPVSGEYTFWLASDDNGELYLSDDYTEELKKKIANVPGWTSPRQWDKYTSYQKSTPITLKAGTSYYMEVLHKEGGGGDNIAVGWLTPSYTGTNTDYPEDVIPGQYLSTIPHLPCTTDDDCNTKNFCTKSSCGADLLCTTPVDISADVCPPGANFCDSVQTCHSHDDGTGYCQIENVCHDFNPCSKDTCDRDKQLCNYQALPDCNQQITADVWTNIGGSKLSNLYADADFPDNPDFSLPLTTLEFPKTHDNYGSRSSGFIHAPLDGEYTFWMSSDDQGEFYLSLDETPENKNRLAWVDSYTCYRCFDRYATQKSPLVTLKAGGKYYFEGAHKEGRGGDHFAVAWMLPGSTEREIIAGDYLSKYPLIQCNSDADCDDGDYCTASTCTLGKCTIPEDISRDNCPDFEEFNDGLNVCKSFHTEGSPNTGTCEQQLHPFIFVGCHNDNIYYPDLEVKLTNKFLPYTHTECYEACKAAGYRYFGLQKEGTCSCGNSYGRLGETECDDCSVYSSYFGDNKNCIFEDPCTSDVDCDDGDWCTENKCDLVAGTCSTTDITETRCPTGADFCSSGKTTCTSISSTEGSCETQPKCEDYNPCSADTCDATLETCSHTRIENCAVREDGATLKTWWVESGSKIIDLYANPDYPENPDDVQEYYNPNFEVVRRGDSYGACLSGYVTAPVTGEYRFWIASDDQGELFISTDIDPDNKYSIASVPRAVGSRRFNDHESQKSELITLEGGNSYYLEGCYKEWGGNDHISVAWATPGSNLNSPKLLKSGYISKYPTIKGESNAAQNANLDGWSQVYAQGALLDVHPHLWSSPYTKQNGLRRLQETNDSPVFYVRRVCLQCADTHQDIIYKRLTPLPEDDLNFFDIFTENWHSYYNRNLLDFTLHSSMEDALEDLNPWSFCNYGEWNIPGYGFPRECGPSGWVGSQWNSAVMAGQPDIGIYVWDQNPTVTEAARPYPDVSEYTNTTGVCTNSTEVFKIENGNFDNVEKLYDHCLAMCAAFPGSTACETVWNSDSSGCYAHTGEVVASSGAENSYCWVVPPATAT